MRWFNGSLGKPLFTLAELRWQALEVAPCALSDGLAPLRWETWTVAVVMAGVQASPITVELAHCQVLLKSPDFCSSWGDWSVTALPGAHPPRRCFLLQEHGKATRGERCKETNQLPLPRGGIWSLCALIFIHFQLHWLNLCWDPEEEKIGENSWFECLWQWMSDDRWVSGRRHW